MLVASTAYAFVCTPATDPNDPDAVVVFTQVWNQRCLPFWINTSSDLLLTQRTEAIVRGSFEEWSNPSCTDLAFQYRGVTQQSAGFDSTSRSNENVVLTTRSVSNPDTLIARPDLLAITVTAYSTETGEIFDADIILNDADVRFDEVTNTRACLDRDEIVYDLANTLVHEIGHFIGFDHTPDGNATMFASAASCETSKRDLGTTDVNGVCTVYPAGQGPNTCVAPDSYGDSLALSRFRNQCGGGDDGCACVGRARKSPVFGLLSLLLPAIALFSLRKRNWVG